MKQLFVVALSIVVAYSAFAGAGGIVVKGIAKTWDEIARVALKASGKTATDDAVKAASKTIETAASKYGDDVAEASMRGGVEVAEQSLKRGSEFVSLLRRAGTVSDEAIRAVVLNSDDAIKYASKYGDDAIKFAAKAQNSFARGVAIIERAKVDDVGKMLNTVASEIPADQISQVVGVAERNQTVAKQFFDGISKGGRYFVDKLFSVNAKQILAGGMTVAMIEVALGGRESVKNLTHPIKEQGEAIRRQNEKAMQIIDEMDAEGKKQFADKEAGRTHTFLDEWAETVKVSAIVFVCFIGLSLLVFVVRKTRSVKSSAHQKDQCVRGMTGGCHDEDCEQIVSNVRQVQT